MRKRLLWIGIGLVALAVPALADVFLKDFGPAGTITDSDNTFWCQVSGGCTSTDPLKRVTALQLAQYILPKITGGDFSVAASGTGTLSTTVNTTPGNYTNANISVNNKGLVTAASNGAAGTGSGTVNNCTAANSLSYYAATGTAVSCLPGVGTTGQVLTSTGAGTPPTFQSPSGGGIVAGTTTVTGTGCANGQNLYNNAGIVGCQAGGVTSGATTGPISATQWANWQVFVVNAAGQTLTLPVATSLSTNGGVLIYAIGTSVTLAPNAADGINGGAVNTAVTIPANNLVAVTTSGTSGVNAISAPLGYVAGTNVTFTPNSNGTTTISSTGSGGGGIGTKIATCTLASVSSCNFNALGAHDYYEMRCIGVVVGTGASNIVLTANSDAGANYMYSGVYSTSASGTANASGSSSANNIQLYGGVPTTDQMSAVIAFGGIASTTLTKHFHYHLSMYTTTPNETVVGGAGVWTNSGTAITSVQFAVSTGTFAASAGKCTLYAYDS